MGYRYGGDDGYFMKRDTALITKLLGVDLTDVPTNDLTVRSSVPESFTTAQIGEGTVVWCGQPLGNMYMTNTAVREDIVPIMLAMSGNTETPSDTNAPTPTEAPSDEAPSSFPVGAIIAIVAVVVIAAAVATVVVIKKKKA